MSESSLLIVGVAAPYVWDVAESITRVGRLPVCVDNVGTAHPELPHLIDESGVADRTVEFVIGIGSAGARKATADSVIRSGWTNPVSLIDKTSTVATSVEIQHGAYVNAGVVVAAKVRIGCFANVNRAVSIGHHTSIGDFAHIGPGATLAGEIIVGAGAFIGSGAVVLPRLEVGVGAIVGAGAVVTKSVPPFSVVVGNPAREITKAEEWDTTCPYCVNN
jgi:sugar O-acyltransferase (sialic acid O-acetyltransferase NeuD family)